MNSRRTSPPAAGKPPVAVDSPWRASRERLRDRAVKREAVIRAAAREFNRKGYHNTSLDDIAARLEVTKPTVYYYVTSKEQLLFQCFVAGVEQIRAAFRDVRHLEVPARERLNAVLRHYGEAVASEFGWCMVRAEDQDLSPAMSRHIKALKSEIDHGIRRLIREGVQDGSIQPCDPKMTAFALAGALNWIAHWYREDQSLTGAQIAAAFVAGYAAPRKLWAAEQPLNLRLQHVQSGCSRRLRPTHSDRRVPGRTHTPHGGAARQRGGEGRHRRRRHRRGRASGGDHGMRAAGRTRPGACAPGRGRRRRAGRRAVHHGQQDVWLGAEGRDAGCGPDSRRLGAGGARRRVRVHE